MEGLRLCLVIFVFSLVLLGAAQAAGIGELPTFIGLCQLQGDMCGTQCRIAGGGDGLCNKVGLCVCRPL
ncbi:uncharacterized protein LOC110179332 [Drosophila serrata]|uniref:uncharacterized protein LOC110179332 n=1 Tax=Drosophila serrata TaxID=7274 RepID=UPI000A1D39F6|nr:uncharacterized protein LOC110179332 [Drosophila serrata]